MMPGLKPILCLCLALDPLSTAMAVLFISLPTAATSYVIVRVMVGGAPLMAAMAPTQHFFAVLTLPLWLLLVKRVTGLG